MKILIFEYASALGLNNPALSAEGYAMLKGLTEDFKARTTDYLISKKSSFNSTYCNPIILEENLLNWLDKNISSYNACLLIAPEEDFILFKLTQLLEKKEVKVIGPDSKAVLVCSDKFKMYEALKDKVNIIATEKVFFDKIEDYKYPFNTKKVIKPADGVSCTDVYIARSITDLKKSADSMQTSLPYFIVQDFVEGVSASVSLLCNGEEAIPISLNLQKIQFKDDNINYNGGQVPFDHDLAFEAKKAAKKAVESIDGLKGYIGVDVILSDQVYIVEINSRLTTPYIALKDITNFNMGEAILDSVYGILPSKIDLNGKVSFFKENNTIKTEKW